MAVANTHFGADKIARMLAGKQAVYFLGIGGITMSSLAHITKNAGYKVGGSDRARSALTDRLKAEGIEIFEGHRAGQLDGYDVLVYTVAVREDTPELVCARARGIPVISRADYLGYLMCGYTRYRRYAWKKHYDVDGCGDFSRGGRRPYDHFRRRAFKHWRRVSCRRAGKFYF